MKLPAPARDKSVRADAAEPNKRLQEGVSWIPLFQRGVSPHEKHAAQCRWSAGFLPQGVLDGVGTEAGAGQRDPQLQLPLWLAQCGDPRAREWCPGGDGDAVSIPCCRLGAVAAPLQPLVALWSRGGGCILCPPQAVLQAKAQQGVIPTHQGQQLCLNLSSRAGQEPEPPLPCVASPQASKPEPALLDTNMLEQSWILAGQCLGHPWAAGGRRVGSALLRASFRG